MFENEELEFRLEQQKRKKQEQENFEKAREQQILEEQNRQFEYEENLKRQKVQEEKERILRERKEAQRQEQLAERRKEEESAMLAKKLYREQLRALENERIQRCVEQVKKYELDLIEFLRAKESQFYGNELLKLYKLKKLLLQYKANEFEQRIQADCQFRADFVSCLDLIESASLQIEFG